MKKAWSKLPLQYIWNSIRKNTYIRKIWHFARHFLTIPSYPRISVKPSLIWCEKHTFENKTFCRPNNANENERATQEKLSFQTSIQSVLFSTWLLTWNEDTGRVKFNIYRKVPGFGPDVSVVSADDCILDGLGGQKLVVNVWLPAHVDLLGRETGKMG